jgi:hypothetical protein
MAKSTKKEYSETLGERESALQLAAPAATESRGIFLRACMPAHSSGQIAVQKGARAGLPDGNSAGYVS